MKTTTLLLFAILLTAGLQSCKKHTDYTASSSFTMVNTVVNTGLVLGEFGVDKQRTFVGSGKYFRYAEHNQYVPLSLIPGQHKLTVYNYPDTTDHDSPLVSFDFETKVADMFTFFMVGTKSQADTMLVKENFPAYAFNDSSFSVRFFNLAPGCGPVNVEVNGELMVSGIAFKARTNWVQRSARSGSGNYEVQFKDQATGNILASYTIADPGMPGDPFMPNVWRRNNYTLALIGDPAASSGEFVLKVFPVRHYFPG